MENVNRELLRSVILNDLKEINQALFNGADIDTQDADGKTALILACEN